MSRRRLWVVLCLSCIFSPAQADESGGWRAAYREGTRQFDVGEFRAALDAFKRAYVAHEEAGILYDIGECHRHLGENADAVHAYRGYLRKKPDAPNRSEVEALIAQLEGANPSTPAAKPTAPRSEPARAPQPTASAPASPPSPVAAAAATTTAPAASAPAAPPAAAPPHGSVYDPWGRGGSAPPPVAVAAVPAAPAAAATTPEAAPAAAPEAAPAATPTATPAPGWAASATRADEPPRRRSKAWIAAIVVPAVVVLAVSIGVTAWYLEPSPAYTRLGPAQ